MVKKIFSLFLLEDGIKKHQYEFIGGTLWEGIFDQGRGCYTPRIVDDWIDSDIEYYSEYWEVKQDYLEYLFNNKHLETILDEIEEPFDKVLLKDIEPYFECLSYSCYDLMVNDLKLILIKNINFDFVFDFYPEFLNKLNIKRIILKIYDHFDDDFNDWAYKKASDNFDFRLGDFDEDNDNEVADFFGYSLEITGYEVDGTEHDISDVFICPSCEKAVLKESVKEAFEWDDVKPQGFFKCIECNSEEDYDYKGFRECNPHISDAEIIARKI